MWFDKLSTHAVVLMTRIHQYHFLSHRHRVDPVGLLVEGRIIPENPVVPAVSIEYIVLQVIDQE